MRRAFSTQAEFDTWHEDAKAAAGLPIVGVNARTGEPQPAKQQTTDLTRVGPAEVAEDGTVIDPTLVATVADERLAKRGLVDGLVRAGLYTGTELAELTRFYPEWEANARVGGREIRTHDGRLWVSKREHDATPGREPPNAPDDWEPAE